MPETAERSARRTNDGRIPDPVGELRFRVLIPTITEMTVGWFSECSGLSLEYELMEYHEGGQNRFVHKLRGGVKYPNLVLKRGITHEDALLKWFLRAEQGERPELTIDLLGADISRARTWGFGGALPVKWQGPSFNAGSNNIATETLEIAHAGFVLLE